MRQPSVPPRKSKEEPDQKSSEQTEQLAFRLPKSLVDRLKTHVERMNNMLPGMSFTRVDAVRTLLTKALDDVEAEEKSGKGSKKSG
jgi:hypothetical protein